MVQRHMVSDNCSEPSCGLAVAIVHSRCSRTGKLENLRVSLRVSACDYSDDGGGRCCCLAPNRSPCLYADSVLFVELDYVQFECHQLNVISSHRSQISSPIR